MARKTLFSAAALLVLAACSSDEPMASSMVENDAMGANPYRVSLTDALKNADVLLSELDEAVATRSAQRKVQSVEYLSRSGTRALGGDTLLYLVNYADDAGFALLSADSRLRPIYAISDEGSLSLSDTTYNKGLALFASGVEAEIEASLTIPNDTAIFNPPTIPEEDDEVGMVKSVKDRVSPMLNVHQRNWDQGRPYNKYCPTIGSDTTIVGCVPIAVGQIMSYHKWPGMYGNVIFDWDEINEGRDNDALAKFLRILGTPNFLNVNYGLTRTSASVSNAYTTFQKMRYTYHSRFVSFNELDACAFMKGVYSDSYVASPILVSGSYVGDDGHMWVLDGYIQYQYKTMTVPQVTEVDDVLYHCVWGWGGKNNGYYYWAKNQRFDNDIIMEDRDDNYEGNLSTFTYFYNITFMAGFMPPQGE